MGKRLFNSIQSNWASAITRERKTNLYYIPIINHLHRREQMFVIRNLEINIDRNIPGVLMRDDIICNEFVMNVSQE